MESFTASHLLSGERPVVLVVEDNVANFVLIARMLAYIGAEAHWKTSGYEVLEFAESLPKVDLVLLDIRLPHEDGFHIVQKMRAIPKWKDVPIVAVTAYASPEMMKKAREAGFDGFIAKPLDPDRFPAQIRRILQGESVWEL